MMEPLNLSRKTNAQGFTLVEVLVAVAVLAIALIALLRALNMSIKTAEHLQEKTYAHWVAENVLVSAQVGLIAIPGMGSTQSGQQNFLSENFTWSLAAIGVQDTPAILLTVTVSNAQQSFDKISVYVPKPAGSP